MSYLSAIFIILFVLLLSIPLSKYLFKVFSYEKTGFEKIFSSIESFVYKLCSIEEGSSMSYFKYGQVFLLTNILMMLICFLVLRFQNILPYSVSGAKGMDNALAFNTVISFMTNTNLQHYMAETSMTFLSQHLVVIFLMFTSSASGIAVLVALTRGINGDFVKHSNFYEDITRIIVRILIPLSFIVTILLLIGGIPQTFGQKIAYTTLSGDKNTILTGPIALFEAIKHIGTNGGGFFGANSAHPFENPNLYTNFIEMLSMMLLPTSLIFTFGKMVEERKHGRVLYASLIIIFILFSFGSIYSENNPGKFYKDFGISTSLGNMEGKETRFGSGTSALFSSITTAYTTGSVNSSLDSYTPLGGAAPMTLMMLNTVFGGDGAGLINIIMYAILTVFITGLMVGRTPEYLGKKIETREVKLVALAILVHPLLILFSSAISFYFIKSGIIVSPITNPSYHGISQMIYEFTSASANNGSEFAGFIGNTPFMNVLTGIVMFLGRYIPLLLMLAVGGSMASKKKLPLSPGTFKTDNALFGVLFIATVMIVGALTFFPAIVLGPLCEFLSI